MTTNPAALQGWVKSRDPNTGRDFYANHVTRKTQWEPPENWREEPAPEAPLPDNWEELLDPTTGKKFYVDHSRQITQWTRPVAETKPASSSNSYLRPAVAQTAAIRRPIATPSPFQPTRTYSQEAAYYSTPNIQSDVDLSDSLPKLEFKVQTVADALRDECPHCQEAFTYSKRRHHCRLCGDVFCDACSNHRCDLPLPGPEFEKPVRVCDFCFTDVEKGNFFSMRRYLTVLHLYNGTDDESGVATATNVNAALSALTQDLDQMVHSADQLSEKLSIPPDILIPEILKHLSNYETCDRAVCCLASLLSLENLAGSTDYTLQVAQANITAMLLDLLDRNASDRRTLFVNEQAAKTLFYLTESKITGYDTSEIDMSRAMRTLLDSASSSQRNPNLQRWSVSTLTNVIVEDQRRACNAVNEVAAILASGMEETPVLKYDSYLNDWVQSGGLMLLGSLVSVDDADTRAQAVTALGAALHSTRSVEAAHEALRELTGGEFGQKLNLDMVRPIVAAGGCGASVAQLLLSAENNVAGMGATFLRSLVLPLIENTDGLSSQYDYNNDLTEMGACREAAVEIVSGSCLPALVSLVRTERRPMDLRWLAMECLAVVTSCVGEIGRSWASGQYEEGLERNGAPRKIKEAMMLLNEEGVLDCALEILQSPLGQSLGSSGKETSAHRIREGAGMLLSALTSCSAEAIMELQNKNIVSALVLASNDMIVPSTIRADGSPRCLGVIETVANLLMFSWQHPSGSEKDLLDTLIEMIDAGAITYISGVISLKSDKKLVGAMRGRAAACRFLCCLFGIALTDSTGIGMRRVMDAVDSDSRSYRSVTRKGGGRTPANVIEATLGVLQTASTMARKIMTEGGDHTAVTMDLVEAALLAVGSMCGSSIPPGGSEGTLVTGESFLKGRDDPYVARRQEVCNFACDILVRGSRGEQSLLPAMVVGGFGEGSVMASIRIALAIAQNGAEEQHAKLAMSGILVPVSDLLRSALSTGDIYKFSASLALVRFCGPHIATGQGGGLQSVRDAIRVATNVLTLPVNPTASPKQIETQESLKAECISALESLSQNASLWSSISTDALPSIARYLQSTAGASPSNHRAETTKTAALRAVLQIVQVPSHAVSAAEAGIVLPLGSILSTGDPSSGGPMLALEVLHVVAKNDQARQKARFLESGLVKSICNALAKSATDSPKQPTDSRADVTFLGLEILLLIHSDVEGDTPTEQLLQSPQASAFLDAIASEPHFIRAVCAAVIATTKMKLRRHDAESSGAVDFDIPKLYGPPLLYVPETCGGFDSTHGAAESLLFSVMVYACALETPSSDTFWQTFLLQNLEDQADASDCLRTSATVAAHVLSLLTDDHQAFVPKDPWRQEAYLTITRPLVRHRLLEALRDTMVELNGDVAYGQNGDPFMTSLLVVYNVPHICLSLWKDPALLDLAFELIKQIVEQDPDEVLHLFVEGKPAIMSLFDLLNLDSSFEESTHVGEIRIFLASVLGQLAENGLLKSAVERYDVRSSAIAALAAACLSEEERPPDEDEDMTSSKLSTVLMQCLVDLCTEPGNGSGARNKIRLASAEASSIATNLGKKICHMVLSRFLERSKLQQYEMDDEENIMDAPDVAMLCAIAQHDEALSTIRSIGGLHALSLVAAEGEISALEALKKACSGDASVLLEGDTYLSMMGLIAAEEKGDTKHQNEGWKKLEALAFELLGNLSLGSANGMNAVASSESCKDCVDQAIHVIKSLAGVPNETADEQDDSVDEEAKATYSDSASDEELDEGAPAKEDPHVVEKKEPSMEDFELGIAACHFLSSLATTTIAQEATCSDGPLAASLSKLAQEPSSPLLRFAIVALLSALATCSTKKGALSPERIGEIFCLILSTEKKNFKTTSNLNSNRVFDSAVTGLSIIFDSLPKETQQAAAHSICSQFVKSVKACIVTRSTTRDDDRAYAAELSYSLASALLLMRGKEFADEVFTADLLGAMVHLIQWHQDPKTSFGNTSKKHWDASVAASLGLLSATVWRPNEVLDSAGIDLESLAGSVLMLARPGKAPRKAIDVKSALNALINSSDASTAVAAQHLLKRLFH